MPETPEDDAALSLGFANTEALSHDELGTAAGLRGWLAGWIDDVGDEVVLRRGDFRALRDAVRIAFSGTIERGDAPEHAVDDLNAASAAVPVWPVLDAGAVRTDAADASATARILAAIARSAIGLLGGPGRARLRSCASCGRFFLASRPGQVWCSASCGNRARVARHRARRTAATTPA